MLRAHDWKDSMTTSHTRLITYLRSTYGENLLVCNGETYPVYTFLPHPSQYHNADSVLVPDVPSGTSDTSEFAIYDMAHLEHLRRTRPHLTNGISYVMDRIAYSPVGTQHAASLPLLRIAGQLGRYFDMLATCDAIDQELRRYARGEQNTLPLRDQLHQRIPPERVTQTGAGRSAVIGVATLTVFNHTGQYRAILARRASEVGIDAGRYHVVPAFVLQPLVNHPDEWSVKHQVCREFGEELFGMPEHDGWKSPNGVRYFYQHPPVDDLLTMLDDGRAELQLTGIAWNPLTLRPEICVLLLIHDADWYPRSEPALNAALLTERQATDYIPIVTLDGLPDNLTQAITPQGAAAFWLGIERARHVIGC